ncbi:MAG: transporter substrate-binding domain-containing protein, partial [Bifidobacteriaceae bacterium]|nr:transporter substrate-binding domain-containing protein [Bifidobacteriaceae bacterium]
MPASSTQSANRAAATVTIPTPAGDPSLAADPAVAKLNGTITFGTEGTYSPFDYHPAGGGALTGYDVDVAKAVAAKLGLTAKFQETTWDALFPALTSHRIDAALDEIEITPQRQATYDLTDPYSVSYPVVITKASDTSITQASDLKGKSSANSSGSNWGAIA